MSIKTELKINITTLLLIIAGVSVFFFMRSRLVDAKWDAERWEGNYIASQNGFRNYISDTDGTIVTLNGIIELTSQELAVALKSDSIQKGLVKKYKKAAAAVKIEWKFHPKDTVEVSIPIYIDRDTTVELWHDCFEVDIKAEDGRLSLTNLYIENRQDIILGARKSGLWRTEQAFDIHNTNPCIINVNATAYSVVVKKRWYEKWWITVPVSFGTGYMYGRFGE